MPGRLTTAWLTMLLAVLTAIAPSVVSAHAKLTRSDPADGAVVTVAPGEIRLWFSEAISPKFSSAQLRDIHNRPIEIRHIRAAARDLLVLTPTGLAPGVYSLLWKVLSDADGHFSRGLLVFGVGEGTDLGAAAATIEAEVLPPMPEVFLRWLQFSLLAALIGALAVARLVLAADGRCTAALGCAARRRVLAWALGCEGLGLAVGMGLLLWQAATLQETLPQGVGLFSVAWQVLVGTRWGALWLAREAILVMLAGVTLLLYRAVLDPGSHTPVESAGALHRVHLQRLLWPAAGALALATVIAQALTGHAAALGPDTALGVVVSALHLLAASVWAGGLLALAVGLLPLMRRSRSDFVALARAGWAPFSRLAALSVGLLLATGLYNMAQQVASVDALITTLYGQALLAKIGLVLAMGAVGLLNAMLLHPQVAAPLAWLFGRPRGWTPLRLGYLPAWVLFETGLALLALLATALITSAPTPRGPEFTVAAEQVPSTLSQSIDDLIVTLSVKPNRPGQNVFTVFAASTRRPAPAEIIRIMLRFNYLDQDLGRISAKAEPIESGRFLVGGSFLSLAGPWQIDVVVRRRGIEDSVARFHWVMAPPGGPRPVVISKYPLKSPLTIAAVGTLLIVLAALAGSVRSRPERRTQTRYPTEIARNEDRHATPRDNDTVPCRASGPLPRRL